MTKNDRVEGTIIIETIYPFYEITSFHSFYAADSEKRLKAFRRRTKGKRLKHKEKIELSDLMGDTRTSSMIAVVFAVTCLENVIYRYGLRRLSHGFFIKHLDRLSLVAKWLIVPKLVTGKSLDEASPALRSMRELITVRNDLVHAKALVRSDPSRKQADDLFRHSMGRASTIAKCAANAPKVVRQMLRVLENLDPCDDVSKIVSDTLQ